MRLVTVPEPGSQAEVAGRALCKLAGVPWDQATSITAEAETTPRMRGYTRVTIERIPVTVLLRDADFVAAQNAEGP